MIIQDAAKQPSDASQHLAEHGYVVLEGFLDAALLAELEQHVEAAIDAPAMPGCERPHNQLVPLRWDDAIVDIVLAQTARLHTLSTHIGAEDLRWISGYVSTKGAHSDALWWHQDWWCWSHPVSLRPAATQVALLCYLGDTSEDSGALRVLPGSHHRSTPLHTLLPGAHAEGDALDSEHTVFDEQPGQVTLCARAGDAVVLDYRLLHGTYPNASGKRRDCLLLSFTPSWRGLPEDVRGHLIQHLALPAAGERAAKGLTWAGLLPQFDGVPADLEIDRDAPAYFDIAATT